MFRTLTVTALFALSLTTASQAAPISQSLNSRILQAAENVCAPLLGSAHTSLLYKQWFADCVSNANAKITARVVAAAPDTFASK